jgi:drug/metabolite transporter (DMT)-like permease
MSFKPMDSPGVLLACVGALLGLNFPLGKLAAAAGVPSVWWAAMISTSAAVVLGVLLWARRVPTPLGTPHLRYFAITALVSYALPNLIIFAAIPQLGSGLTALFYTLSPILTVGLAGLAGLRRPGRLELVGIAIGLVGALLVVSGRGEVGRPAALGWVLVALVIPLSLAIGNVYRSIDWPRGADALWLAVGSNAAAAVMLLVLALATSDVAAAARMAGLPWVVAAQALAASLMFLLFFRLQQVAGPVTLSQIGTVAAAVGVGIGALALGERYPAVVWVGVAVIATGLACTVWDRARGSTQQR